MTAEDDDDKRPAPKLPHSHRPRSGSETRQRGDFIGFRAAAAEKAFVKDAAARAGLSVSSYTRAKVMMGELVTRETRRPTVEVAALARILAQQGKCGSNLNQIARVLNSGGDVERESIVAAIADFRAVCALIMRALGKHPTGHSDISGDRTS